LLALLLLLLLLPMQPQVHLNTLHGGLKIGDRDSFIRSFAREKRAPLSFLAQ